MPTAEVLAALAGAKVCDAPVTPTVQLSAGFKCGCLCGKGHPAVSVSEGTGSPEDRKAALVLACLAIRPVDSIDEACRDHDVSWILHDDGSGECNQEFFDRQIHPRAGERCLAPPLLTGGAV